MEQSIASRGSQHLAALLTRCNDRVRLSVRPTEKQASVTEQSGVHFVL